MNWITYLGLFFFKKGLRTKRLKLFLILSFIPALILLIMRLVVILNPKLNITFWSFYIQLVASYYFQLFIPLLALFYGSSVLHDEIDNQTLVYLTTKPVPKYSILLGKYLGYFLVSGIVIFTGLFSSFVIANITDLLKVRYLSDLFSFAMISLLAVFAYSNLFNFFGVFLKKSVLLGILFIFGWEYIVQFIPGIAQKLTIIHYVNSLLPGAMTKKGGFLFFSLQPSSTLQSIITLLVLAIVFMVLSIIIFYKKEYRFSDDN